ncbi:MAG: biotin--[acetyl-CoA-carboxylase] ligase, partial [Clostridia bacterium]
MATKDAVLQALQNSEGAFLSGEELSNKLSVSRTTVWKAIKALREEGHPIEAVTNRGYMLMSDSWTITEDSLRACLPTRYKNLDLHIYDTIDSTNLKARQLAMDGAPHGTVVLAKQQTSGRGRLGRSFFSPREGIYLSIVIKPDFDVSKSVLVTSAAAVAVANAIEKVCGLESKIKWVNDVYIDGKKVCGILTEGISDFETGQIEHLILGIGINTTVKDFPAELLATAGAAEGTYSKSALAAETITQALGYIEDLD